jgi:hypothetical protein
MDGWMDGWLTGLCNARPGGPLHFNLLMIYRRYLMTDRRDELITMTGEPNSPTWRQKYYNSEAEIKTVCYYTYLI